MFLQTGGGKFMELLINAVFDEEMIPHPKIFMFKTAWRRNSPSHESAFKLLQWRKDLRKDMSWRVLSVTGIVVWF